MAGQEVQPELFDQGTQPRQPQPIEKKEIPGLWCIKNYITTEKHDKLLAHVDEQPWLDDIKRRVQHYGFKYDYRARKVNYDMHIGELPGWLEELSKELYWEKYMPEVADQVIINEYLPGQGISAHIDCEPCFKDTIVSLSLGSNCVMNFTNKLDKARRIPIWLEPRSLIVMEGEARYKWLHSIPARVSDEWGGERYDRQRRVSLTFRKVIIGDSSMNNGPTRLRVTMPGGEVIECRIAADTVEAVIFKLGPKLVSSVDRENMLISRSQLSGSGRKYRKRGEWYISRDFQNEHKKELLERIAERLGISTMKVEIIPK
ncbi:alpha-ketoglutarate-dependent dioxygenase AlkB [Candidatus Poribacteria bacterium]|nr:alpha-ketoglutarate-dependent dioxygenase AlkB [Candidatus Poribacteria bacterium]MYH80021.1 alpha-ketoglutarate-dependent dioxygenase AlkB [Candidatus Poribacteria bacterium]